MGMFDLIANYPANCINWHDRWSSPTLAEARAKTDKCLLGDIREVPYFDGHCNRIRANLLPDSTVDEVERHVREAIDAADGRGLILGLGYVADRLRRRRIFRH